MGTCTVLSYILKYSPMVGAEAQEVLSEEVRSNPRFLKFVPDVFKNQEMCINAVGAAPWLMLYVPPHFIGPARCLKGLLKNIYTL